MKVYKHTLFKINRYARFISNILTKYTSMEEKHTWKDSTEDSGTILAQEKCIKQFAQNVRKNAKYRSNLQKVSRYIVETALARCQRKKVDLDNES